MSIGSLATDNQDRHNTARNCAHHDALYGDRGCRLLLVDVDQAASDQPPDNLSWGQNM